MKVLILAGGLGSRMEDAAKNVPKPMIEIAEKPILEWQIELGKRYGYEDYVILSGHKSEVIESYFNDGSRWGVRINYSSETSPLGTAGSVKRAVESYGIKDDFFVFYGDVIMDVNLKALEKFHHKKKPLATLVIHPNDHPYDSDIVEVDESDNRIVRFHGKPHHNLGIFRNLTNAALYVMSPEIMKHISASAPEDFGRETFIKALHAGAYLSPYFTTEYLKDIGTPERLTSVESDIRRGIVHLKNISLSQAAVFIDRDGVINKEVDNLKTWKEFELIPLAAKGIKRINGSTYLAVVVTNQPVIAKGFTSENEIIKMHNYMETMLGREGCYVDKIYFCPHHPDSGFEGERKELKIRCACRKPDIGMIQAAVNDLNIDLSKSFMIGDRTVDVMTGINAGLKTIIVNTGYQGRDGVYQCEPDFIFSDLDEAAEFITNGYHSICESARRCLNTLDFNSEKRIILIGGLSCSGKSIFTKVLYYFLKEKNLSSRVVNLDNWIVNHDERKPKDTVRERYQYKMIEKKIQELLKKRNIKYKKYDRIGRCMSEHEESIALDSHDLLLVDGVVALDIPYLREQSLLNIYVKVPEEVRKKRFFKLYANKGLEMSSIEKLYRKREHDECLLIRTTEEFANAVITMESV